jgi:DNA-binding NarL/FixJ family response regulator
LGNLKSDVERLRWRRDKVLQLPAEGNNQSQIASILQIAISTVNRDYQVLKKLAQTNISKYINETLPLEYQKCMIGLDAILVKSWSMANSSTNMERDKLQALSIAMQAYE